MEILDVCSDLDLVDIHAKSVCKTLNLTDWHQIETMGIDLSQIPRTQMLGKLIVYASQHFLVTREHSDSWWNNALEGRVRKRQVHLCRHSAGWDTNCKR